MLLHPLSLWQTECCGHTGFLPCHVRHCGRLGVVTILDSCYVTSLWQTGCCGHAGFLLCHVPVAWQTGCCGHAGFLPLTSICHTGCCGHAGFLPCHVNVADWVLWPCWILVMSRQYGRLGVVAMLDSCYVTSLWQTGCCGHAGFLLCHVPVAWQTGCCGHTGFLPFHVNVADWVL